MTWIVDIVLVLAGLAAVVAGWRRGALRTAGAVVGVIGGLWIGLLLAPLAVTWVVRLGWSAPLVRTIVAGVVVVACTGVVFGLVTTVAALLRRFLARGPGRGLDAVGGAALSAVAWAVAVWLVASFLQASPVLPLGQLASSSRIAQAFENVAPIRSSQVFGALDDVLRTAGFPEVFADAEERIRPVARPDAHISDAVRSVGDSVVEIHAAEPSCGTLSEGSGWVVEPGTVVTNAHVVAGSSRVVVQPRGSTRSLAARLVAFDPRRDLAVLAVPDLRRDPLPTGDELEPGASAVVAGYPRGGPYTVTPARVRQQLTAAGTGIYDREPVTRSIYALRASVRKGNSGGPLLDERGRVVGIVFAKSTTDADTGYALTLDELRPVLERAEDGATVGSGGCTPD